ncbi:MAG: MoaD/ThiS family protein [Gammaproteobacteria bacterium]
MSIQVKFFASLRERLGTGSVEIEDLTVSTVREAWQQATQQNGIPANTLCAINMQYAKLDDAVRDGDEVAFFPPVTGG